MSDKVLDRLLQMHEDRRQAIINKWKFKIIETSHNASYAVHEAFDQDPLRTIKFGRRLRKPLTAIRKFRTPLESIDKLMTLEGSRNKAQTEMETIIKDLNDELIHDHKKTGEPPFKPLQRQEAEKIVKEASDAWKSGVAGFKMGDPNVDAHQNGNFDKPKLPGQFRPDLRLPGKLFRQE